MPRQGLTKDIIISEAIVIINQIGYSNLTFVNLAQRLKVKPPAMFKHFKNMDDLKRLLTLRAVNGLKESLQKALVAVSGEKAITSFCHAYRNYARMNSGLYSAMQAVYFKDNEIAAAATHMMSLIISVLNGFDIDEQNYIHLLRLIRSSLHGFVILETDFKFGMSKNIDDSFQLQIDAIVYMIKSYSK